MDDRDRDEATLQALKPDFRALLALDCRAVSVTARGASCDFVSRFFAPKVGIVEGAFFNGRVEMGEARASSRRPTVRPGVPLSSEETERMLAGGD